MTSEATETAEPSTTTPTPPTADQARRPRAARRAPSDLPFTFADRGLAEALSAERAEPDWLRAERLAAARAFEALPVEPNQLYTLYLDLRAAELADVRPYIRTANVPAPGVPFELPAGVGGLIELHEDSVGGLALAPEVAARGVVLETFGAALARDPDGLPSRARRRQRPPRRREAGRARPRLLEPGRPPPRSGRRPPRRSDRDPLVRRRARSGADRPHEDLARRRRRGFDRRGARRVRPDPGRVASVADRRNARGHARSRREAGRLEPPGAARDDHRLPAPARRHRRGSDAPLGARPARRRGSFGAAWTTASKATGAASSRSRSCSVVSTSSSTSPRTPATSAATRPATSSRRGRCSRTPGPT